MRGNTWWVVVAIAIAAACSSPDDDPTSPAAGASADDHNDSFDDAIPVVVDEPGLTGAIEELGDVDYFVFHGRAGDWIELQAVAEGPSGETFIPLVTLYDATQTQIARGIRVATHLSGDGTYCASVRDISDLLETSEDWIGVGFYTFVIVSLVDGERDVYFDLEAGDDAPSARDIPATAGRASARLLGTWNHIEDRDVFAFTLDGTQIHLLGARVADGGPNGNGAADTMRSVSVTDETGTEVVARTSGVDGVLVPLAPGRYLLWGDRSNAPVVDDDFYEIDLTASAGDAFVDSEGADATGTNDTPALADANGETLPFGRAPGYVTVVAYLPPGDVDYLGFDAPAGTTAQVGCFASHMGSGLRGLSAELRDLGDSPLGRGHRGTAHRHHRRADRHRSLLRPPRSRGPGRGHRRELGLVHGVRPPAVAARRHRRL